MPLLTLSRPKLTLLISAILFIASCLASAPRLWAQDDSGDIPLGDVARSFRKKSPPPESVVDNDNLSHVVDDAESRRASGASPVFSLDPGGKTFHVSSPDVTCSLSFTAKTMSDSLLLEELPRSELAKLDGPAMIDGDSLQVSMHNGTSWQLREVVIGLTIVKRQDAATIASYGLAKIVPTVISDTQPVQDSSQKQADVTILLHVKGSAAPTTTAIFRTPLNFALFPDQEWHWAIVKARGIPPQPSPDSLTAPEQVAGQFPPASPDAAAAQISPTPLPSNPVLLAPPAQASTH